MDFTWLPFDLPGKIFRSAMPYSFYDPDGNLIQTYKDNNVSMIVMLAGEDETLKVSGHNLLEEYKDRGFEVIYLPIEDFGIPDLPEIRKTIPHVLSHSKSGGNIAIHCHAGVGRTGMFVACLAKIGMGFSPEESINWVREYIPGAIEAPEQEQLVRKV